MIFFAGILELLESVSHSVESLTLIEGYTTEIHHEIEHYQSTWKCTSLENWKQIESQHNSWRLHNLFALEFQVDKGFCREDLKNPEIELFKFLGTKCNDGTLSSVILKRIYYVNRRGYCMPFRVQYTDICADDLRFVYDDIDKNDLNQLCEFYVDTLMKSSLMNGVNHLNLDCSTGKVFSM